ncbi:MAG: hypothetical protein NTW21_40860 [Verrucomicrobia bacterium]|nr:hypothetical protein [Verrucomicrobiota bacterium]
MVRKEWTNLNGLWDYAIQPLEAAAPEQCQRELLVPLPCEAALSGVRTYDRKRLKMVRPQTVAAQRGEFGPPPAGKDG